MIREEQGKDPETNQLLDLYYVLEFLLKTS
jgi:hypothetical protein